MASDRGNLSRKMAAIMHADVAGSTALVQLDEALTHGRINDAFSCFSQSIEHYGGTVHEIRGDALVAEFSRASDAVCAALAFQKSHGQVLEQLDDEVAPKIRIGVSLGEVIFADGQVTGVGVVLAQRVEQLAEPGGLCITGAIHEALPQYMPFDQESLGEQKVKGFDEPVRVYAVGLRPGASIPEPDTRIQPTTSAPDLPDKPSIAVLPFTNMSGDPEQTYFSDGITEDIITELSRFHALFVIARNSSFSFRDLNVDVTEVGQKLGVRYVVEGSVRKAANTVRVTAQLVAAANGYHLWAERYDRELEDIFAVQDEITQTIVTTLPGRLEEAGRQGVTRKPTANLTAYDYVLLGLDRDNRVTHEENIEARRMYQEAVNIDPQYARAHALLASTYVWEVMIGSPADGQLDKAFTGLEKALSIDDNDAWTHGVFGYVFFMRNDDEQAEVHFRQAVALNPNDADTAAFLSTFLVYTGRWEEGLEWITRAKRLNPICPPSYHLYHTLALYSAREYEEAVKTIKKMRPMLLWGHGYLAASYAHMNQLDEAHSEIATFINAVQKDQKHRGEAERPVTLTLASERAKRYRNPRDREHFLDGLRKAGLPE